MNDLDRIFGEGGSTKINAKTIEDIGKRLSKAGKRLHEQGLVIGSSGNISARIPGTETFLIKPSGARMEFLKPEELVLVDLQGKKVRGELDVSLETPMHAATYRARRDVQAVVHTHPPTATAFGIAKTEVLPLQIEMFMRFPNGVPVVPFEAPGSKALAETVQKKIASCDALILENHGIITVGSTIEAACDLSEMVEEAAKIQFLVTILASKDTVNLEKLKQKFKTESNIE
ncbi:class II aldolase/adducin family protein [Candidatus Bathyarchaeota archaeon A05DMB-2]|nr:class II aldolase/adducin family protein [Candidatus Bathyarchaeota archaeon A05DMB-2]